MYNVFIKWGKSQPAHTVSLSQQKQPALLPLQKPRVIQAGDFPQLQALSMSGVYPGTMTWVLCPDCGPFNMIDSCPLAQSGVRPHETDLSFGIETTATF